jgi:DNA-binding NarL/FixJ family response regulator
VSERIRVVLVEDQVLVRAGLRALIEDGDEMEVVGEAGSGVEGVAVVAEQRPDVALVDVRLPAMDGVTATRLMTEAEEPTRVIVLTAFDDEETVFGALRAGASGFLLKDTPPEALLAGIRTVVAGDALIDPEVTRLVIERALTQPVDEPQGADPRVDVDGLTPRERDVLRLVAAGRSNDEITNELVVSPATTKTHIRHLLTKTGSRDRAQLVVFAYEVGLVTPRCRAD